MKIVLVKSRIGSFMGQYLEGNFLDLIDPVQVEFLPVPQPGRVAGSLGGVAWITTMNRWPGSTMILTVGENARVTFDGKPEDLRKEFPIVKQYLEIISGDQSKVTH